LSTGPTSVWEILSSIFNALTLIVVVFTAVIALRQFRESLTARHLQGALGLMQLLESGSVRSTRHFFSNHRRQINKALEDGNGDIEDILRDANGHLESVEQLGNDLAILEYTSALALLGLIPNQLERSYFIPVVVDAWRDVEPFAKSIRKEINSPVYLQHLEALWRLAHSGTVISEKQRRQRRLSILNWRG
jgi:hypothetical protein